MALCRRAIGKRNECLDTARQLQQQKEAVSKRYAIAEIGQD